MTRPRVAREPGSSRVRREDAGRGGPEEPRSRRLSSPAALRGKLPLQAIELGHQVGPYHRQVQSVELGHASSSVRQVPPGQGELSEPEHHVDLLERVVEPPEQAVRLEKVDLCRVESALAQGDLPPYLQRDAHPDLVPDPVEELASPLDLLGGFFELPALLEQLRGLVHRPRDPARVLRRFREADRLAVDGESLLPLGGSGPGVGENIPQEEVRLGRFPGRAEPVAGGGGLARLRDRELDLPHHLKGGHSPDLGPRKDQLVPELPSETDLLRVMGKSLGIVTVVVEDLPGLPMGSDAHEQLVLEPGGLQNLLRQLGGGGHVPLSGEDPAEEQLERRPTPRCQAPVVLLPFEELPKDPLGVPQEAKLLGDPREVEDQVRLPVDVLHAQFALALERTGVVVPSGVRREGAFGELGRAAVVVDRFLRILAEVEVAGEGVRSGDVRAPYGFQGLPGLAVQLTATVLRELAVRLLPESVFGKREPLVEVLEQQPTPDQPVDDLRETFLVRAARAQEEVERE